MRKRIFEIIEKGESTDRTSRMYDVFMIICILLSLFPLTMKTESPAFLILDKVTAAVFCVDYVLRLVTADYKLEGKGITPFIRYPFTAAAIIDLISILPSVIPVNRALKVFRVFRIMRAARLLRVLRAMKVFRVAKTARYSKSISIIANVLVKSKEALLSVGLFAGAYIIISALIIFNVEPDSFGSFFDAIYWATVSLTTVGYGDIYPVSVTGRVIAMISSLFGIAIVALPAGIITAGYMEELTNNKDE